LNQKKIPGIIYRGFAIKKYSGWELNPHARCGAQDFKSCVSTSSTTRVTRLLKKNPDKVGTFFGAEDRARTGHPDLGKVVLYQMSYFRRCILLEKHCCFTCQYFLKELFCFWDCKNKVVVITTKIFSYLYFGLY
jgi:hypothetical protein